jgi:predicted ATPase/class 3 adenylate cyclase
MSLLPTGTVTLLFTDIEGSARLWERYPDAMTSALELHDELLRSAIESAGGYVFKTIGDAFCAAFTSAKAAVEAAGAAQLRLHAQAWPEPTNLLVRMALYTGECEERGGDYFGPAVNRTARLVALGHGGQILVARSTSELIRDRMPTGTHVINLGSHSLRGLERPEEVFQLVVDEVSAAFPPLRSHVGLLPVERPNPTNLAEPVSSFVGRDSDVAQVVQLLSTSRLVTLTGSGGVGKTRLATEIGRLLLDDMSDGVWLVELASVGDSDMVAAKVQRDLGIVEQLGTSALDTLLDVMTAQRRLVILDNCEQVLDGCALVAETLLRRCPDIKMLLTSREPLRIGGEIIYRVPSLSLPPELLDGASGLAGSGAVALFMERAVAQKSDFQVDDRDAALVASICRHLDGVPLALELATARLGSMSLVQLHDRLGQRFALLTGGSRTALPRQQTLAATVDWSYDLLSEPEKALFRRTSVFVDGFDLAAAEGVCALTDITESQIVDHLASLVAKSLVVAESHGDGLRYRLQETLRQYGTERLAETASEPGAASEADSVADAHATYYLTIAERAEPGLQGRSYGAITRQLEDEDLNVRAAIEHAIETARGADKVLHQFWCAQRYWRDARRPAQSLALLEQALERAGPDLSVVRRAQAHYCRSALLRHVDRRLQLEAIALALELAREAGDASLEADALVMYSRSLVENGRNPEAVVAGAQATELARKIDDPKLLGAVLFQYGTTLYFASDPGAEAIYLEALALATRSGDALIEKYLHNNYAFILLDRGNLADARRHQESSLELSGTELSSRTVAQYDSLAEIIFEEGDVQRAAALQIELLRFSRLNGLLATVPYQVSGLACCASKLDQPERAALLHGGAEALLLTTTEVWELFEVGVRARDIESLRERLGEEFDRLYEQGFAMPHDDIIKLALAP